MLQHTSYLAHTVPWLRMRISAPMVALLTSRVRSGRAPGGAGEARLLRLPEVRMSGDVMEATRDIVAPARQSECRLRIVKRAGRYYWASTRDRSYGDQKVLGTSFFVRCRIRERSLIHVRQGSRAIESERSR